MLVAPPIHPDSGIICGRVFGVILCVCGFSHPIGREFDVGIAGAEVHSSTGVWTFGNPHAADPGVTAPTHVIHGHLEPKKP